MKAVSLPVAGREFPTTSPCSFIPRANMRFVPSGAMISNEYRRVTTTPPPGFPATAESARTVANSAPAMSAIATLMCLEVTPVFLVDIRIDGPALRLSDTGETSVAVGFRERTAFRPAMPHYSQSTVGVQNGRRKANIQVNP